MAVNGLLDARKVSDKLDAEIKLEQAKKAEREKALAPPEQKPERAEGGGEAKGVGGREEFAASERLDKNDGDEKQAQPAPGHANDASEAKTSTAVGGGAAAEESSGTLHKRSASVLSGVSDKSAKRQKK